MTTAQDTLTILHLGLGSFHRAHQALYLHQLHQLGDTRWVLAGGNLRPDMQDTIAALQAQGGAYTLETVVAAQLDEAGILSDGGKHLPADPGGR